MHCLQQGLDEEKENMRKVRVGKSPGELGTEWRLVFLQSFIKPEGDDFPHPLYSPFLTFLHLILLPARLPPPPGSFSDFKIVRRTWIIQVHNYPYWTKYICKLAIYQLWSLLGQELYSVKHLFLALGTLISVFLMCNKWLLKKGSIKL